MAQYGNHEIELEERLQDWAPRFAHPHGFQNGTSYSFDVGEAHFTSLFVAGPLPRTEQLAWLDDDLSSARQRGQRWLIVYQHKPLFAHGHSHPAGPRLRQALWPILQKHKVDLHLSAHDQNYERTYPLRGHAERPEPACKTREAYAIGSGTIFAKVSPAGKRSDIGGDFSRFTVDQQDYMAVRDDTAHHYAQIDIKRTGRLEFRAYAVSAGQAPKTLLDRFEIVGA